MKYDPDTGLCYVVNIINRYRRPGALLGSTRGKDMLYVKFEKEDLPIAVWAWFYMTGEFRTIDEIGFLDNSRANTKWANLYLQAHATYERRRLTLELKHQLSE